MTTTTSSSNKRKKSIFGEFLLSYKNFSILYGIILFILIPLTAYNNYQLSFSDLFIAIISAIIIPYFMVGTIFGFLHNKRATDLYGALPVKREKLLLSIFGAGYLSIIAPLIINYGIKLSLIGNHLKYSEFMEYITVIFSTCLYCFILMAIFTFVTVLIGTKLEYFGYAAAVSGSATVILFIIYMFCNCLYGFGGEDTFIKILNQSSPIMSAGSSILNSNIFTVKQTLLTTGTVIWTLIGIAALIFACILFKKRKSEIAENAARATILGYIIRFIGAFCGGVAFYLIGFALSIQVTLMAAIGGFLGYIICDIIFKKSFVGITKAFIPSGICAVLMAMFCLFFEFGGFGYETKVPEVDSINSIELTLGNNKSAYQGKIKITSDEGKKAVTDLHKYITDSRKLFNETSDQRSYLFENNYGRYDNAFIRFNVEYQLKSGKLKRNYYRINYGTKYKEITEAITEILILEEAKKPTESIFALDAEDIVSFELSNKIQSYKSPMILSKADGNILLNAMRHDLLNKDYKSMLYEPQKDYGIIHLVVKNDVLIRKTAIYNGVDLETEFPAYSETDWEDHIYFAVSENDKETLGVLRKLGYYEIMEKGFDNIVSVSFPINYRGNQLNPVHFEFVEQAADEKYDYVHTEDKSIINDFIAKSELYSINSADIETSTVPVNFILENGMAYNANIRIKDIPKEIFEDSYNKIKMPDEVLAILKENLDIYPDYIGSSLNNYIYDNPFYREYEDYLQSDGKKEISDEIKEKGEAISEYNGMISSDGNEELYNYLHKMPAYSVYIMATK